MQPSIDLAKMDLLTLKESNKINRFNELKPMQNKYNPYFKNRFSKGDSLKLPDLAQTLILIRDYKRDGFYKGKVAKNLVKK